MKARLKYVPIILVASLFLFVAWGMISREDSYLWKVQELNLFLDTSLFFKQQLVVAGGMLTYLGTFFTDFFYHTWLGVTLLCAWWALLLTVSALAFKVPMKWLTLLLIPVSLLVISDVDLGYWIYYLKLRGYFFSATIGMTVAVASVWVFRSLCDVVRRGALSAFGLLWLGGPAADGHPVVAPACRYAEMANPQYRHSPFLRIGRTDDFLSLGLL